MNLKQDTLEKVAHAGELLIRAAAVLGTLPADQQEALRQSTDGSLPDAIILALQGAKSVSPQIRESLTTHPPVGLIGLHL